MLFHHHLLPVLALHGLLLFGGRSVRPPFRGPQVPVYRGGDGLSLSLFVLGLVPLQPFSGPVRVRNLLRPLEGLLGVFQGLRLPVGRQVGRFLLDPGPLSPDVGAGVRHDRLVVLPDRHPPPLFRFPPGGGPLRRPLCPVGRLLSLVPPTVGPEHSLL